MTVTSICGRHYFLDGGSSRHGNVVFFHGRGENLIWKVAFVTLDLEILFLSALLLLECVLVVAWDCESI